MAKPMKPSTGAACWSQWSTFSSEAPRPSSDRGHALAALARARLGDQHLGILAGVDALDLPHVDLDPVVVDLLDRPAHQLRAQLGVVAVRVAADGLELAGLGRDQQLEEELAVVGVQPVGQPLEAVELALVRLGVAFGVEADEDLREVRVVGRDVLAEGVAVLEVELVLPALLDRHRELEAELLGELRECRCRTARRPARPWPPGSTPRSTTFSMPSKISFLASLIVSVSSGVGSPSIPNIFFWNDPR